MQLKGIKESDLAKLRADVAETAKQMSLAAQQLQQMEQVCGKCGCSSDVWTGLHFTSSH